MAANAAFASAMAMAALVLLGAVALGWRARRARAAARELLRGDATTRLPRWLQPLGAELARCRQQLAQLDAARQQALSARDRAEARSQAAHEMGRDAQLGLNQARAGLEQLRAAQPQRALQQSMERARARAELDRLLDAAAPALAALRTAGADACELARAGAAAQAAARAAADALHLLAINARIALERGARDELADAAAALERRGAELGAQAERAVVATNVDSVAGALEAALEGLDVAVGQARAAPAAPGAVDADLEADLAALARDLSNTMLQLQTLLRATGAVPQSGEADVNPG